MNPSEARSEDKPSRTAPLPAMPPKTPPFSKAAAPFLPPLIAWPAWLRLLALAPVLILLWLGVAWALPGAAP